MQISSTQHVPPKKITSVKKLLKYLQLSNTDFSEFNITYSARAEENFRFKVSSSFVQRIQKSTPNDPLLLQILPQKNELEIADGFSDDPLEEQKALLSPGLLQKYHGRVLLIVTSACGIHCRYCFRKHFPYQDNKLTEQQLNKNIILINKKKDISEVILSGGDPLTLSDAKLAQLINQLSKIKHLTRLRIHSRQIIIEPKRMTSALIESLQKFKGNIVIVVHINHANEIDTEVVIGLKLLKQAGLTLLNQSVLLKGVNDSIEALISLSESLLNAGVLPYYLHMMDSVKGSQHFEVKKSKARSLIKEMKQRLPGYLVPKLVQEYPNDKYKQGIEE